MVKQTEIGRRRDVTLLRRFTGALGAGVVGVYCGFACQPVNAQQTNQQQSNQPQQQQTDRSDATQQADDATSSSQYLPDESPALGLVVGSCPGNAVCVMDTVWGSPADQAGIRNGDYLLSIDDQQLSSPQQLRQILSEMGAGEQVNVKIWRGGQEFEKQLTLAQKADRRPDSHRAYLGVMLSSGGQQSNDGKAGTRPQVTIERVVEGSPADQFGLRPGDIILSSDGNEVVSVEGFIETIEQKGPGTDVQLTILRNDQRRQLDIELGDVEAAPMNFFRQAMNPQMVPSMEGISGMQNMMAPLASNQTGNVLSQQMLDESLDDLRQRVRQLEKQIQELQGSERQAGSETQADSASQGGDGDRPEQQPQSDEDGNASNDSGTDEDPNALGDDGSYRVSPEPVTLAAQQRDIDRNRGRGRDYDGNRGHDWDGDRRWNRDYGNWRDRYQNPYGNRLYRSPRYGNQYYRYGGRSYYNGLRNYGVNPYYSRPGIRFGNFGIYWY